MTGPYGAAANDLYARGWRGILLLPARRKAPPPEGQTGVGGTWASGADVWARSEDHPSCNVGIRLPPNVIGFDVDDYADKQGAATWAAAHERYGPLPATWIITSRTDGVSGIRLYSIPEGLDWPGELGPGIEVLKTTHRYAVAPPSVHPEGRVYRWEPPTPQHGAGPPSPGDLPALPDAWVAGFTGGRLAVDTIKVQPGSAATVDWYTRPQNSAEQCGMVRTAVGRAITEIRAGTASRHDAALKRVMALAYMSSEGHTGVVGAIEQVRAVWFAAVTTGSSARSEDDAAREWHRIMSGALAVLAADGGLAGSDVVDRCANPMFELLEPQHDGAVERTERQGDDGRAPPPADPDAEAAAFDAAVAREVMHLRVRAAARDQLAQEDAAKAWQPPVSLNSLTDELALPDEPVAFLVDELMTVGANVVLTAAFKSGKTTLVNDLVRCLVDDEPFLGRYATHLHGGRVALWNYEVSAGQYRRWLRDLGIRDTDRISVLNLRGTTMPLKVAGVRAWAVKWLIDNKISVWVVDPFARAVLGSVLSENDNTEIGAFLELLDVIKEESGVSELIIPTHTGRVSQEAGAERSRGATRVDDWADVRWLLTRDNDGGRFFRASGRDVETPEGTLSFDPLMRSLTLIDGGRDDIENIVGGEGPLYNAIVSACAATPGLGVAALRLYVRHSGVKAGNAKLDNAVNLLAQQGVIEVRGSGSGRAHEHFIASGSGV